MNASVSISQHVLIFEPRWNCFRLGTQEQSGIPVVLFDRMITKPSDTNCVVKYTLK